MAERLSSVLLPKIPQPSVMLKMIGICKRFSSIPVLTNVDLTLYEGEVLALMGENGAGKSTLMKILCGIHQPTSGTLRIGDEVIEISGVADAMRFGFVLIHQELNLLDNLDIAGNLFLGREPTGKLGILDQKKLYQDAVPLLKMVGLSTSPATQISHLSLAQQQLVEIAKALSQRARVLVMDEPTSSLTPKETERLFATINELKEKGVTIVYISHRLNEIKEIADRAVVLRDGQNSGELLKSEITHENLIRLMIGRDIQYAGHNARAVNMDGPSLRLEDVRTARYPDEPITFDIRPGEILGISGLIGSGRTELMETIAGIHRAVAGNFIRSGKKIKIEKPKQAIDEGIYLVPEDRKKQGIFTAMSVLENITIADLNQFAQLFIIRRSKEVKVAQKQTQLLQVKCDSLQTLLRNLSGGNQQKVAIGKWLVKKAFLIIFDEPTRGVDVGAKGEIYAIMRALADQGILVMVVSSDMEEIIKISDRILVMREGQIRGELLPTNFTEENIMSLAVGHA